MIGINSLGENVKTIQKEMDLWKNPEVMVAEEELERLHDEVPLHVPANKGPENAAVSLQGIIPHFLHKGRIYSL